MAAGLRPPLTLTQLEALQFEAMADDVPIDIAMITAPGACWSEDEARTFFESGGVKRPAWAKNAAAPPTAPPSPPPPPTPPVVQYQSDMFGTKRGRCLRDHSCQRYVPRLGLMKTEGLGGLAIAKCSRCGHDNLAHEDLGKWMEGEPQLVDEDGRRFVWKMVIEGGGAAKSKQIEI